MEEAEEEEAGSGVKKSPREYIDVVLVGGGHANVQVPSGPTLARSPPSSSPSRYAKLMVMCVAPP
jgi:hypothetical protein